MSNQPVDIKCTEACGGCAADAGEQRYRQCNADGTAWGSWSSQCSTSCAGPCGGGPCVEQVYQCNANGQWEYRYPQCSTIARCGTCTNASPPPSPPPTPPPPTPPPCNTAALTITPNPANVGQQMTFQYNSNQSTYVGNAWSPSNSVASCNEQLANYRVICTAQNVTASPDTWTHSWGWNNWNQCSRTATYTINPGYTPWIQVTGDVHSNEGINAPGGP